MHKVKEFAIIDHGVDHEQYFQGYGTCCTRFDKVVTGIGETTREAYDDALEQMAMDEVDVSSMPEHDGPDYINCDEHDNGEIHVYVAILYNVE